MNCFSDRECGAPQQTAHGTWSYEHARNGDTAQLNCTTGYILDSDKVLTCNANGSWMNGPKCVGMSATLTFLKNLLFS